MTKVVRRFCCTLAVLVTALSAIAWAEDGAGDGWKLGVVDSGSWYGLYSSVGVGSDGSVHVSFKDGENKDLKYAVCRDGKWTIETVDVEGQVGDYSSLALNSEGEPCIAYLDETNKDIKFATHSVLGWDITVIDDGEVYASVGTDLILAEGDVPYVVYFREEAVRCAHLSGGHWIIEEVEKSRQKYAKPCLAIDSGKALHVSYYYTDSEGYSWNAAEGLRLATRNSDGSWTAESVDDDSNVGSGAISLAYDKNDNPHIIYYDAMASKLKYAEKKDDGWSASILNPRGYSMTSPGVLIFDEKDIPHIFYSHTGNSETEDFSNHLEHMYQKSEGLWENEVVDGIDNVGSFLSAAFDADGAIHLTYFDGNLRDLRYCEEFPEGWHAITVGPSGYKGKYGSTAIDSRGRVHASYFDWAEDCLKYALCSGDKWTLGKVDDLHKNAGRNTDIALNEDDEPYITYQSSDGIMLAALSGDNWGIRKLSTGKVKGESSIAFDREGEPHIVFVDNFKLSYFSVSGDEWVSQEICDSSKICALDLAFDSRGTPYVTFYDDSYSEKCLKMAFLSRGSWAIQTLDHTGDVGEFNSMVIDDKDNIHIGYFDSDSLTLKYMEIPSNGDDLRMEVVDSTSQTGQYASIALDGNGSPCIAYFDGIDKSPSGFIGKKGLKYAHRENEDWIIEDVDDSGLVHGHISLDVDGQGHPFMVYYGDSSLRFAQWGKLTSKKPVVSIKMSEGITGGSIEDMEGLSAGEQNRKRKDIEMPVHSSIIKLLGCAQQDLSGKVAFDLSGAMSLKMNFTSDRMEIPFEFEKDDDDSIGGLRIEYMVFAETASGELVRVDDGKGRIVLQRSDFELSARTGEDVSLETCLYPVKTRIDIDKIELGDSGDDSTSSGGGCNVAALSPSALLLAVPFIFMMGK